MARASWGDFRNQMDYFKKRTTSQVPKGTVLGKRNNRSGKTNAILKREHYARMMRLKPTGAEQSLWDILHASGLAPLFKSQHVAGRFILDFYCQREGLCIEVDGGYHKNRQFEDLQRDSELMLKHRIRTIRIPNDLVLRQPTEALKRIYEGLGPLYAQP